MANRIIKHIGIPRRSGRYPWGSGKEPYQGDTKPFVAYVNDLRKQGLSDVDIAKGMKISTTELRNKYTIAIAEKRASNVSEAMRLKEKGYSDTAIGRRMGVNESTVRSWLNPAIKERAETAGVTANILKDAVDSKGLIDIGIGTEQYLGVTRTKLDTSIAMLKENGYEVHTIQIEQPGTGKYTNVKVLAPPGTTLQEVNAKRYEIKTVTEYSEDGGRTFLGIEPPTSVSSKRVLVKYKEDGGADKDGLIELRPGLEELSLGGKNYAQVRIGVDDKYFMKGMAMYSHKMPDGVDIIYNVNKEKGTPIDKVFKPMKDDPDNPFGSSIRQRHYIDPVTGKEKLSPLNIVGYKEGSGEEGSWHEWSRNLSSQILSKQTPALAKKQLELAYTLKKEEFDEIMSVTNPSVKRELLRQFSDGLDSDAVHLKAAALPGQNTHVLLPFKTVKENEVYAPNYNDGDQVVLIRHPHGGIFEIPELKVNNNNREAKAIIGNALDAVGINPKVAQKLSGADFDGDSVIVIPNRNKQIITDSINKIVDFDPKIQYKEVPGMKIMNARTKGIEMGKVSNLITDMTLKGASFDEVARAVKHSMVVIDAEKHRLNWTQSAIDNNISDLKKRYQGKSTSGASTLISRAKAEKRVNERAPGISVINPKTGKEKRLYIDPKTGEKLYRETGRTYIKRTPIIDPVTGKKVYYYKDSSGKKIYYDEPGKLIKKQTKTTQLADEKDPYKLSSGTKIENVYAKHSLDLKSLANKARLEMIKTKDISYSPSAKETYRKEVDNLTSQLASVYRNKPRERQAILLANKIISAKRKANPDMTTDQLKKVRQQALNEARNRFGASRKPITISDRQWEAIQAGAISPSKLARILENTKPDLLKQMAMPRYKTGMSPAKLSRAKTLLANGYTSSEVAEALGVSVNTIIKYAE